MRKFLTSIARGYLLILLTVTSCSYLENDGTEIEVQIFKNILLQKQIDSNEMLLVFKKTKEIYFVLAENCDSVFHDSNSQIIWTKSIINDHNNSYYQIKVLDTLETNVALAIQKKEISKQDFVTKTSHKVAKWDRSNKLASKKRIHI
ncbi:hypothetical protein [Hymenobacter cavernae]|uniref:Lipoprotein n=1 Tax=Hymenobacter cavernae TaxID=2044852 RepID=A0ABQ1URY9_9BACT|nr:hypothetical protein [Hymenobacter cavernae]GGF23985.1 hypothetical protein GCM10011383_39570 [Hymenobacter cavernae]